MPSPLFSLNFFACCFALIPELRFKIFWFGELRTPIASSPDVTFVLHSSVSMGAFVDIFSERFGLTSLLEETLSASSVSSVQLPVSVECATGICSELPWCSNIVTFLEARVDLERVVRLTLFCVVIVVREARALLRTGAMD